MSRIIRDRRLGRFAVLISEINKRPEMVKKMLADCIVIEARTLIDSELIEYVVISPYFREVEPQEVTPYYAVNIRYIIDRDTEEVVDYRFEFSEV